MFLEVFLRLKMLRVWCYKSQALILSLNANMMMLKLRKCQYKMITKTDNVNWKSCWRTNFNLNHNLNFSQFNSTLFQFNLFIIIPQPQKKIPKLQKSPKNRFAKINPLLKKKSWKKREMKQRTQSKILAKELLYLSKNNTNLLKES